MSDHFSDFDEQTTSSSYTEGGVSDGGGAQDGGQRGYSNEVFSEKVSAKYRTFFIDVKENAHGHLVKVSEKSRGGKKSTVMMDAEDLTDVIAALTKAKNFIDEEA